MTFDPKKQKLSQSDTNDLKWISMESKGQKSPFNLIHKENMT